MDPRVVEEKLESVRRCVTRVEARCPGSLEGLVADVDAQDIVTLNLTRAVQLCVDIAAHVLADRDAPAPDTMGGAFDALAGAGLLDLDLADRMKRSVGFRNIAVHNYQTIDWRIVHHICRERLGDFRAFARAVAELIAGPPDTATRTRLPEN
jgi:uncharacterized protein YutE (UPF0331/DUF86 family)